jgi:thiamine-phosphate pyrophosphorylase
MRRDFTPAVVRALEAAERWARGLGAAEVEPAHLLYGLLDEEEGRAAVLLTMAGLDLARVRAPAGALPAAGASRLALSAASQAILTRTRELAGECSAEETAGSEYLLLALLYVDEAQRRQLESLGLDWSHLEAAVTANQSPPLALEEPLDLPPSAEQMATGRILDACANRAREALRVVEDYCRFALDDAFLSGELKRLRHDLAEALVRLPANLMVEARDTPGDVGTGLSTEAERTRHSLLAVAQANLKRLQEALRSLEEFGKLAGAPLGQALEQLRYRAYTLERAILIGTAARQRLADARLYVLVSGAGCVAALDWTIREAAAGGAQIFQLREKDLPDRALLERARQVRRWTREVGALFIVNDRPDIARLAEADGVHLGQDELSVAEARRILGPDALVGVSTHDLGQVRQAILDGASYVGIGPTFPSGTKAFADFPGLDFVRQAMSETSLPAFVIGGVTPETLSAAVEAGARRAAISQAICQADDPRAVASAMRRVLDTR